MSKQDDLMVDFLDTVDKQYKDFVQQVHEFLLQNRCRYNIKSAKSGYTASYVNQQNKRTIATFITRKSGMKLRLFPEHILQYQACLNTLPDNMKKDIKKASVCKRLVDPNACNPRCIKGYEFMMDNEVYQKCRYSAFQHAICDENNGFMMTLLEKEIEASKCA
ncbi:hypothetical protein [Vallitalea pronyensis]|nr:hypothetical protein [Vallitalea pronyensis]